MFISKSHRNKYTWPRAGEGELWLLDCTTTMHGFTLACNLCPSAEIVALHTCLRLIVYLRDYASYMYLYHFHMYAHLLLCYFLIIISIRS
jgi:hypothetical protein